MINPSVTALSIFGTPMSTNMMRSIIDLIKISTLTKLFLLECSVNENMIDMLTEECESLNLTELFVSDKNISPGGAPAIAKILQLTKSLTSLDITYDSISYESIIEIIQSLATNDTIKEFTCQTKSYISHMSADEVTQEFTNIMQDNHVVVRFDVQVFIDADKLMVAEKLIVELTDITARNKETHNISRFAKTKVAAPNI